MGKPSDDFVVDESAGLELASCPGGERAWYIRSAHVPIFIGIYPYSMPLHQQATWRSHNYTVSVIMMYDDLRIEIREYAEGIQGKYDHPNSS
jgi:hypothetical protein